MNISHGQEWSYLPTIVSAGDYIAKAGFRLLPRKFIYYELIYFLNPSNVIYRSGDRAYRIDKPGFVFIRPDEVHGYDLNLHEPTRHIFIHFLWNVGLNQSHTPRLLSELFYTSADLPFAYSSLKHILQLANEKPALWRQRCSSMLYSILHELESLYHDKDADGFADDYIPQPLKAALDYLEENLHRPIKVSELVERSNWTRAYFTRKCCAYLGLSPQMLILHRRLERAAQLLIYEKWSIKQVAYAVGFLDEYYFSRCFQKMKGMTASQFREKYSDARLHYIAPDAEGKKAAYPLNQLFVFGEIEHHPNNFIKYQ